MDKQPQQQQDQSQPGVGGGDVAKFGAALLAALGVQRAARWRRERKTRKQQEQRAQQQAAHEAEIEQKRAAGHEQTDARFGLLAGITIAGFVFAVLLSVGLWALFNFFTAAPVAAPGPVTQLNAPAQLPPPPRLQADPQSDWLSLRATETALLNSYSIDPAASAVRIPIERAMDIVATRGISVTNNSVAQTPTVQPGPTGQAGGNP